MPFQRGEGVPGAGLGACAGCGAGLAGCAGCCAGWLG